MQHEFWQERWQQNKIGFHQADFHAFLTNHFEAFYNKNVKAGQEDIFVPLCGKTLDLNFFTALLKKQSRVSNKVIGSELSELACSAYFTENSIAYNQQSLSNNIQHFASEWVELFQGDHFKLSSPDIASCSIIYDRAAIIALPEALRQQYAAHFKTLFPNGASLFLVTIEYPQNEMDGPPFSVPESEVRELFNFAEVEVLDKMDLTGKKFGSKVFDLSTHCEKLYKITW